jgi:hypothetical protein
MLAWLLSSWPLVRAEAATVRLTMSTQGAAAAESSLIRARRLAAELPDRNMTSFTGGEFEMHDWWQTHAKLFKEARAELGQLHPALYELEKHAELFIQPSIRAAVEACERAAREGKAVPEDAVHQLLRPAGAPGVWRISLFTKHFCVHRHHYHSSCRATRRPAARPPFVYHAFRS